MKKLLEDIVVERPVGVVMSMLYEEIHNPPLANIIKHLNTCTYIHEMVIALAALDVEEYISVNQYFKRLNIPHLVVWCNDPQIQDVLLSLQESGLDLSIFFGQGKDA